MSPDEAGREYQRRKAAGVGCGRCCYCDLGAEELCRHYDLDLAVMDAAQSSEARPSSSETRSGSEGKEALDEPIPSSPTTTPDSLGDVMGGESEGNTAFRFQPCGEASPDGEVFGHQPQHFDGKGEA